MSHKSDLKHEFNRAPGFLCDTSRAAERRWRAKGRVFFAMTAVRVETGLIATKQRMKRKNSTVASHVGAIYRKLNIASRPEATLEAVRIGLVRVWRRTRVTKCASS